MEHLGVFDGDVALSQRVGQDPEPSLRQGEQRRLCRVRRWLALCQQRQHRQLHAPAPRVSRPVSPLHARSPSWESGRERRAQADVAASPGAATRLLCIAKPVESASYPNSSAVHRHHGGSRGRPDPPREASPMASRCHPAQRGYGSSWVRVTTQLGSNDPSTQFAIRPRWHHDTGALISHGRRGGMRSSVRWLRRSTDVASRNHFDGNA
jgi:hypothetical protein